MAKRKQDPSVNDQLDRFGVTGLTSCTRTNPNSHCDAVANTVAPIAANDAVLETDMIAENVTKTGVSPEPSVMLANDDIEVTQKVASYATFIATKLSAHQAGTSQVWLNDEWWTTAMVCAYFKLGRKAIWERQRDARFHFPKAFDFGSMGQRWKSEDVIAWARESSR